MGSTRHGAATKVPRARVVLAIGTAALLAATGCSSSEPDATDGSTPGQSGPLFDPGDVVLAAAHLEAFDGCQAFLDHVKERALDEVGPYGLEDSPMLRMMPFDGDVAMEDGAAPATTAQGATTSDALENAPAAQEGTDYSGTNVQEEGVDEPDTVKTDGVRLVAVIDDLVTGAARLEVVDVSGAAPAALGEVGLPMWNASLLLDGDRAWAIGSAGGYGGPMPVEQGMATDVAASGVASSGGAAQPDPGLAAPFAMSTTIAEVDLTDLTSPTVVDVIHIEGSLVSARLADGRIRVVTTSPEPSGVQFEYPSDSQDEDRATEANRELIRASTIEQWLPSAAMGGGEPQPLVDCANLYRPSEFSGFAMVAVSTIDTATGLGDPAALDAVGVLAGGETVYASASSLYVATNRWLESDDFDEQGNSIGSASYETAVHRFDISGDGPATYVASGTVRGHVLNQFAMSEHDDNLRVATTDGSPWMGSEDTSESFVTVLALQGDALVEIGQVGDLGPTETIQSVRFIGDTAYVVTFRQTDPLYVVDLADPTNPRAVGELHVPGFSAYLHPLGDGLLLGVGQDGTAEGVLTGAKVSLFDVSDPASPTELATWTAPGNSSSEVQWDHHAFLWWPATQTAVLPVSSWSEDLGTPTDRAVVLHVDRSGITEVGSVTNQREATGQTACREVGDDEIAQASSDDGQSNFGDEVTDGVPGVWGYRVLDCPDGQGGMTGWQCSEVDDAGDYLGYPVDLSGVPEGHHIEVCSVGPGDPIRRSLVVSGNLLTVSAWGLLASDLGTLTEVGWLAF